MLIILKSLCLYHLESTNIINNQISCPLPFKEMNACERLDYRLLPTHSADVCVYTFSPYGGSWDPNWGFFSNLTEAYLGG